MNILRMRYFIDVAKLENITKAAQMNYISQTAMSQQIANIESELEIKLFTREKGRLRLTKAGESFYEDCQSILKCYDAAVRNAQEIWKRQYGQGEIRLGVLTSSTIDYLDDIIDSFSKKFPAVAVKLVQSSFASMRNDLEQGLLDLGICPQFNFEGITNIDTRLLYEDRIGFLVPIDHPLAAKDSVHIPEITSEKIIMTDPSWAGISYNKMLEARLRDGYQPNIVETASSASLHAMMVAFGRGCAFLPERMAVYDAQKCKMLHIADGDDISRVGLAWKTTSINQPLEYLIALITDFFKYEFEDWIEDYLEASR